MVRKTNQQFQAQLLAKNFPWPISAISFMGDQRLAIGFDTGLLNIMVLPNNFTSMSLLDFQSSIVSIKGINERYIIVGDIDGNVFFCDGQNSDIVNEINISQYLSFIPPGVVLHSGDVPEKVHIKQLAVLPGFQVAILITNKIVLLPPFIWGYNNNQVFHAGGSELYPVGCSSLAVSSDEQYAVWTSGTAITIYSTKSGKIIRSIGAAEAYFEKAKSRIIFPLSRFPYNNFPLPQSVEYLHTGQINSVDISIDKRFLITGSDDQTVRIWDFLGLISQDNSEPVCIVDVKYPVNSVSFLQNNRWFAISNNERVITMGDVDANKNTEQFIAPMETIDGFSVSFSRTIFVVFNKKGTIVQWSLTDTN